tara:strand:- start:742 stop:981 length:240 start_codon:yes stop_codon:yes gene_type:complete
VITKLLCLNKIKKKRRFFQRTQSYSKKTVAKPKNPVFWVPVVFIPVLGFILITIRKKFEEKNFMFEIMESVGSLVSDWF